MGSSIRDMLNGVDQERGPRNVYTAKFVSTFYIINPVYWGYLGISPMITFMKSTHAYVPVNYSVDGLYIARLC